MVVARRSETSSVLSDHHNRAGLDSSRGKGTEEEAMHQASRAGGRACSGKGADQPSLGSSFIAGFFFKHRLKSWVTGILLAALTVCAASASADIHYVYDPAGRLVEVIAPNGDSAQYNY